jgi:LPXTG-motif cell wall-anchored protein
MNTRRSVLVIILAAVLLSSMVGMASASSQTWYWTNTVPSPSGVDYEVVKDGGRGNTHVNLGSGTSKIWVANEYVTAGPLDMHGTWTGQIRVYVKGAASAHDVDLRVDIGKFNPTSSTFTSADHDTYSGSHPKGYMIYWNSANTGQLHLDLSPGTLSISNGEYLAAKFSNEATAGDVNLTTWTGSPPAQNSPTYIDSPSTDPGYPVPELSTMALTGIGMLALGGFVLYRRRRNNK